MTMAAFLPYRIPRSSSPQESNSYVEAQVHDVTPAGLRFTVKDWDQGKHVFGPAPWPMSRVEPASLHDHPETVPTKGMRALVLFLGDGIDRPWVIGVWPA